MLKKNQNNKINLLIIVGSFAVVTSLFNNCSRVSTDPSELANDEVTAELKSGFIAPTSTKGQAVRVVRRSLETNLAESFVVLKEYRHKTLDRYYMTARLQDQNLIENGAIKNDWEQTGYKITILANEKAGYSALCRFYISTTQTHFYTANPTECQYFKNQTNFVYEGIEGYVVYKDPTQQCGVLKPMYRIFSNAVDVNQRRHRYTGSSSVVSQFVAKGWLDEKLSFCAEDMTFVAPIIPPNPQQNNCTFNNTTIPHGQSVVAYLASSSATCSSQQRTCNNGVLSGSYQFASCTVTSPAQPPNTSTDYCPNVPVHFDLPASSSYKRMLSGGYSSYGQTPIVVPIMYNNSNLVIRLTVLSTDTSAARGAAMLNFSDIGSVRAGRYVTISKSKCDFTSGAKWISGRDIISGIPIEQNSASKLVSINSTSAPSQSQISVDTGVWYINVKNVSCPANVECDVVLDWAN